MMKQLPLLPLLPLLLLFSLLTGNSSACTNGVSKVISTEGTDVMLPCSPSIRENLQNKLFDWKKVGQGGAAQHEVFMWDSADHYDDHSGQSEQFKGRVSHFQNELQHGNASIVIRETKVIDSGSYTCVFPRQPSEEFCIELVVDPILKDRTEEKIAGASPKPHVKIIDQANSWARLQCEVHGAHPEPKVEWRNSSGNILPAEEPQVSERGGSYDVILQTTVTKTDNYSCVSSQEEINHQISAETLVHISGAVSKPHVLNLDQTKDFSLLQCEVNGAFPKPLLQWTDSSGNMVPAAEPQVSERGGSYDVILQTTVTKTDNYSCVASQEEIKSKPAHIYVSLSGEEPERSSGSITGWIAAGVLSASFFVVLVVLVVVGGVVHTRVVSKDRTINQLNEKIEKLEDEQKKTSSQDTLPADSVADPPENKILLE